MLFRSTVAALIVLVIVVAFRATSPATASEQSTKSLDTQFTDTVHPFLTTYCISCHSGDKPKGDFDLKAYTGLASVESDAGQWTLLREKVSARQMPPDDAKAHPSPQERKQIVDWINAVRIDIARKDAGDPGVVLARRLSNSEFDYTIRDLTGVDIQPTREFPVDPSNTAGFDNSGESLAMSPELLNKYLAAAREVADYMYLKQKGFAFAQHTMLSESDRDQFCENQIVDFYHTQDTDYADYFQAAWRYKNRAALGKPNATMADIATDSNVSEKYLASIWGIVEEATDTVGPVAKLQTMWRNLPSPVSAQPDVARQGCEQMRDYVVGLRKKIEMRFTGIQGAGGEAGPIWLNTQYAIHRMNYDPAQLQIIGGSPATHPALASTVANSPTTRPAAVAVASAELPATRPAAPVQVALATGNLPGTRPSTQPALALGRGRGGRGGAARGGRGGRGGAGAIANQPGDPDLVVPAAQRDQYQASFAKFAAVFPDRFYTSERSQNYFNIGNATGHLLSAGFLNRMGYFRDDVPLYQLVLDKSQQDHLDEMWRDMDFIASLMKPCHERGKYASWIAPPRVGVNNQPGDFEYVRIY